MNNESPVRRAVSVALMTMLLFGCSSPSAMPTTAQAWDEVLIIANSDGDTFEVGPRQVGVIRWRWGAASRDLVSAFWSQVDQELVLTREGDPGWSLTITSEEARQHLTSIERAPQLDHLCGGREVYVAYLAYYLRDLEPGFYTLHSRVWLPQPITDGCDMAEPDGSPDIFEGNIFDSTVYINVLWAAGL